MEDRKGIIYNQNCLETMDFLPINYVDVILTSPFYNTNKKAGQNRTLCNTTVKKGQYDYVRYDTHVDNMTDEEYSNFTVGLFKKFDKVLKKYGCVLYNIMYGSENTEGMFKAVYEIISKTAFTIADVICWKKPTALPNSCSPNKLTRIWEFVFVFCRKDETKTFYCNKKITSQRKTGQNAYENIFNFIEAPNNSGSCPFNKATYSVELCEQLLDIYAPANGTVYDPFMGSGTTAVACIKKNLRYIGSEISKNQVDFANNRIDMALETKKNEDAQISLFDILE